MANTVEYIYEILDRYSAPLRKISNQTRGFSNIAKAAQNSVRRLSNKMENFANRAQNLQGALGALGLGKILKDTVGISSSMESAMADIGRVTDVSAAGLLLFEDRLEGMSELLGKSKEGLARMAYEGGRLGVSIAGMEEFLMMTSRTAIAFDMLDEEAGRAIGSIQAKMGLLPADTQRLLDSINYLADTTSANGAQMVEIIERLSGTFKLLEFPPEIAAAFAGFANQVEVTPELAASGMNMMLRRMRKMPGMTTKLMEDPIKAVIGQLEKMAGMGPELRTRYLEKLFGAEASRFVEKAVTNVALFGSTLDKAMSTEAVGSMQRELENVLNRSGTVFEVVAVTARNTMDTLGDIYKPFAVELARGFTGLLQNVREFAKENPAIVKFAAGVAAVTVAFTALAAAAGVLMAALAPLTAVIASFGAPILAVVGAVTGITIAYQEWAASGHPVVETIDRIIASVQRAFSPISRLIGLMDNAIESTGGLSNFFDKLGHAVNAVLTPVELLLVALERLAEYANALFDGNFANAAQALQNLGSDTWDITAAGIGSAFQAFGAEVPQFLQPDVNTGVDNSQTVRDDRRRDDVSVTGDIYVTARDGIKIGGANINLNGGGNIAHAQ